jgi:acetone carboxylase gamma subunit
MRCKYLWIPKLVATKHGWKQIRPKICPECKSKAWNEARERSEWDGRYKRNFDDGG